MRAAAIDSAMLVITITVRVNTMQFVIMLAYYVTSVAVAVAVHGSRLFAPKYVSCTCVCCSSRQTVALILPLSYNSSST
jgi:hypothetical protein